MDVTATLAADVPVDALFDVVEDLGTYPDWLDIVSRAEPVEPLPGDDGVGGAAAWSVDLRGQVGPFRRSKRLRMVRTRCERPDVVRFERREHDGKRHSEWVLSAELVDPGADGTTGALPELRMRLHYGGNLWVPMLDRLLSDEIERSRPRLVRYVNDRSAG
ncbi:SRPBCC family protein [Dermatobacter hominis]|uniref:SRPBCC family protein n=1 Tax=Dermatobacter hominis TaxID=2884263 RepID=UPI001D120B5C|nr:SRPBCC family protein [Dermatobacter hominis]UDY36130.1 SRPBCC family protein [Dermatobacter hominis]